MAVTTQSPLLIFCLMAVMLSSLALTQADTADDDSTRKIKKPRDDFGVKEALEKMNRIQTEMENFKEDCNANILMICAVLGVLAGYNVLSFLKRVYDCSLKSSSGSRNRSRS
eukprot:GFUD01030520.1.p1 GENE.GFUD01030520.1~~GFUD01030520.1.p1  ORF type:complete len:112 (+),score=27.52 GFUD01030520.1:83-418(+)